MDSGKIISKLVLVYYRKWASKVANKFTKSAVLISSKEQWDSHKFNDKNNYIFIGWSWLIPDEYIEYGNCYCIHPSDLPMYRGGSPIQNQIIDGVTSSYVTLFQMDKNLDSGPIFAKVPISFEGYLEEIFGEIIRGAVKLIKKFEEATERGVQLSLIEQNLETGFICKRRSQKDSIIPIDNLSSFSPKQIYDMVRCLQEPYPKLAIQYPDGSKLILNNVGYEK